LGITYRVSEVSTIG
jgi:hypothetical protein